MKIPTGWRRLTLLGGKKIPGGLRKTFEPASAERKNEYRTEDAAQEEG